MKKTFIKIQTQFEGIHKYPEAPKIVAHLRNEHRHTFIVTVQIEVKHNNRDLEFYMVKDYLDGVVHNLLSLNNKSCEMIGDDIHKVISQKYGEDREMIIEVSEDGKRSSVSYYKAIIKPTFIVVIGKIGCGKTVISKELVKRLDYKFIEVSDVVKELTGRNRDTIRLNQLTGEMVAIKLISGIDEKYNYIVSGVRQLEILEELRQHYKVILIKLDLSEEIRLRRVNMREKCTLKELRESDMLDSKLGLNNVIGEKCFTIYDDYTLGETIDKIVGYLKEVL